MDLNGEPSQRIALSLNGEEPTRRRSDSKRQAVTQATQQLTRAEAACWQVGSKKESVYGASV